jgi:hypothetical protein
LVREVLSGRTTPAVRPARMKGDGSCSATMGYHTTSVFEPAPVNQQEERS